MVCRGLLLMLDRAGQIELPPVIRADITRWPPSQTGAGAIDTTPIEGGLRNLQAAGVSNGSSHRERAVVNSLLRNIINLGSSSRWRHLKYLVLGKAAGRLLHGPRPRVIWAVATATLVERRRSPA